MWGLDQAAEALGKAVSRENGFGGQTAGDAFRTSRALHWGRACDFRPATRVVPLGQNVHGASHFSTFALVIVSTGRYANLGNCLPLK